MSRDRPESESGTSSWYDGLPTPVRDLLSAIVQDNLLHYDILKFYHLNPYAILTVSDLSVWVTTEEQSLAKALQRLTELGFLTKSRASSAFTFDSDPKRRHMIDEAYSYLHDNPDLDRQIRTHLRHQLEVV